MTRIASLSFAFASLALAGVAFAASAAAQKAIKGDWITLGDVAPVTGEHAGILLGPAPPPGETLALDPAFLIATARQAGVILAIPLDQPVMVTRAAGAARPAMAANQARTAATAPQIGGVQAPLQVLVLVRDVPRGHVIASGDVNWEDASASRPIRNGADMELAIGKEVRRALKAGQPILAQDLKLAAVIRKGDQVKIVYATPGVRLSVEGVAQNEAARGEPVRVLNSYSKRTIDAVAEANGEARVSIR
jgi:flagella basal body P-ring formation protein FlgA